LGGLRVLLLRLLGLRPLRLSLLLRLLGGLRMLLLRLLRLRPLWLGLLGPRLRLLGGLRVLLLRLRLRPLLRLLRGLRVLLLCGWRTLLFLLLGSDNRPEKQKQGGGTGNSNELHSNHLR
jgi:hypothetical protein